MRDAGCVVRDASCAMQAITCIQSKWVLAPCATPTGGFQPRSPSVKRARTIPRMRPLHLLPLAGLAPAILGAQTSARAFRVEETTIAQVHAAFKAKTLTCHYLVQEYFDSIR